MRILLLLQEDVTAPIKQTIGNEDFQTELTSNNIEMNQKNTIFHGVPIKINRMEISE